MAAPQDSLYDSKTDAKNAGAAPEIQAGKLLADCREPAPGAKDSGDRAKAVPSTYCNPMNLDYAYVPEKPYSLNNNHRSTADATAVRFKDEVHLFSTNQEGYWSSKDLGTWRFNPQKFKPNANNDQICAPGAWATDKGVYLLPSFNNDVTMPLYFSEDPGRGKWTEAVKNFPVAGWDPALFQDDDKRLYLYWGSSNFYPLRGVELDPQKGFAAKGEPTDLVKLQPKQHGWEQFGQNNQNGAMDPFIEGATMNKFNGKYYLEYAAPGTEWNVYGDGVYTSKTPLGPFEYQKHNPFCWKPTGFVQGAGHGSTFPDNSGNLWHIGSMIIGQKDKFERRISMFPTDVDKDGVLHSDTSFGDYPHRLPNGKRDANNDYTGWTLLSYNKKAWASEAGTKPAIETSGNDKSAIEKSVIEKVANEKAGADKAAADKAAAEKTSTALPAGDDRLTAGIPAFEKSDPKLAFDENVKTFWSAGDAKPGKFLAVDLGKPSDVHAIQVNYADDDARAYGKQNDFRHRYEIHESADGKNWNLLVDKSESNRDTPHDYVELKEPVRTQFIKITNVEMPTGNFALSDFRVFGKAPGAVPDKVEDFAVNRDSEDRRNATLNWKPVPGAYAYEVSFGVEPDKLYSSLLVHGEDKYEMHSLNTDSPYFFKVRSVGETGISDATPVQSIK
ncbi:MAG: family 43 glycosylhydrolase [Candidatus Melainabacteria bacterium]|nr:family 43 glycosylhydrolase [Candidatus Melainabacteria bacterium]